MFAFVIKDAFPKVIRSFEDIRRLRELLMREFPGLRFPPLNSGLLIDVIAFFKGLWALPAVLSSDLLGQFLQSESAAKVLTSYRNLHEAFQTKSDFLQHLWSKDSSGQFSEIFKETILRTQRLKEVETSSSLADVQSFNDFCDNQARCIQGSLGLVGNLLTESVALMQRARDNIAQLEPIFTKLKLQAARLSFARELFPDLKKSKIELDAVFDRLQTAASCLSKFTRPLD